MVFKDTAPKLNTAGITLADVDAITIKTPNAVSSEPTLDKATALAVLAEFADIEAANGYVAIAQKHRLTTKQVKDLHKEFLASRTPAK